MIGHDRSDISGRKKTIDCPLFRKRRKAYFLPPKNIRRLLPPTLSLTLVDFQILERSFECFLSLQAESLASRPTASINIINWFPWKSVDIYVEVSLPKFAVWLRAQIKLVTVKTVQALSHATSHIVMYSLSANSGSRGMGISVFFGATSLWQPRNYV